MLREMIENGMSLKDANRKTMNKSEKELFKGRHTTFNEELKSKIKKRKE